jgi:ABC-type lipoprotein release transport system permease subunit
VIDAVRARAKAVARRRWRAWLALGLLIGLAAGIVVSLVAGGRRVESAYDRFLAVSAPSDVAILDGGDFGFSGRLDLDRLAALPEVEESSKGSVYFMPRARWRNGRISTYDFLPLASQDGRLGTVIDRPRILAGRAADPDRPDEAVLGFVAADRLGLEPGDEVTLTLVPEASFQVALVEALAEFPDRISGRDPSNALDDALDDVEVVDVTVRVVGIVAAPGGFPPLTGDSPAFLHVTPAFAQHHADAQLVHQGTLFARVRDGVSIDAFKDEVARVAGDQDVPIGYTRADQADAVNRSLRLQAVALWALAGLIGAVAVIVLVQVLRRVAATESGDDAALRSIGFTRHQLVGCAVPRAVVIAASAAVVTVVVAVALSAVWSSGVARRAEPDPGLFLDARPVAIGIVFVVVFVLAVGLATTWLATAAGPTPRARRFRRGALLGGVRLPLPLSVGRREALDRRPAGAGSRAGSAVVMLAAATAAFAVTSTFESSLDRFLDTPEQFGWGWDLQIGGVASPDIAEPILEGLAANPDVEAVAAGAIAQFTVEDEPVTAYALDDVQGEVPAVVLEGRSPQRAREIALGGVTLRAIGAVVGDEVSVSVGETVARFRVVGRAVFPNIGDRGELGTGARVTWQGYRRLVPEPPRNTFLVAFGPGADAAAVSEQLRTSIEPVPATRARDRAPNDLQDLGRSDQAATLAALALSLLAVATLWQVLVTSASQRRVEHATLRTLGLYRRDLLVVFTSHALTLCVLGLLFGLPLGIVLGRWSWMLVADRLGFLARPEVPVTSLAAAAVGLLVVGAAASLYPGWRSARQHPARGLRTE